MSHSYHMEARIKAERLKLWEERKRRGEVATGEKPPDEDVVFSYTPSPDRVLVTDPGQFYLIRSVHEWTGIERNRKHWDYSVNGPLTDRSWKKLREEIHEREKTVPAWMCVARTNALQKSDSKPPSTSKSEPTSSGINEPIQTAIVPPSLSRPDVSATKDTVVTNLQPKGYGKPEECHNLLG